MGEKFFGKSPKTALLWPYFLVAGFLSFAIVLAGSSSTEIEDPVRENLLSVLEQFVDQGVEGIEVPGATAAVILSSDRAIEVAAGYSDLELRRPMTTTSRMLAGSVGKTYVAALMMSMVVDGDISLDDKLIDILGDEAWYSRLPNAEQISIRNLLNHSTGLARYIDTTEFSELLITLEEHDADHWVQPRELISYILDEEPQFPAGSGYKYSDTNYLLAGIAMEKVGGFRMEHEIVRRFLYRLNLPFTGPQAGVLQAGLVQGYLPPGNRGLPPELPETMIVRGVLRWNPLSEWAGGGFISNSGELARWAKLLWSGEAMHGSYLDEMVGSINPASTKDGTSYALGVSIAYHPEWGTVYSHGGVYPGYGTYVVYLPEIDVAAAVQVNNSNSDIARYIAEALISAVSGD